MDRPHSNQHLTASNRSPRRSIAGSLLIGGIRIYQAIGSPFFGKHCRFEPTCSHYGVEAIEQHGAIRGSWLTLRRLTRCHPLGSAGWDPVPCSHERGLDKVDE